LTLLVGQEEGHPACKNWVLVCWWWHFDWSFSCLIAAVVTTTSIILRSNKIQNGDILVTANPGPPRKWPFKSYNVQRLNRQRRTCWSFAKTVAYKLSSRSATSLAIVGPSLAYEHTPTYELSGHCLMMLQTPPCRQCIKHLANYHTFEDDNQCVVTYFMAVLNFSVYEGTEHTCSWYVHMLTDGKMVAEH